MSESAPLVPVTPASLAPANCTDLSPAKVLTQINPARVIDTGDQTIYWFIKIRAKQSAGSVSSLLRDPAIARQCAMIVVKRGKPTFTLQWYPVDDKPQVFTELPMDQLLTAVQDLKGAGF